jgi:hypothetical protein
LVAFEANCHGQKPSRCFKEKNLSREPHHANIQNRCDRTGSTCAYYCDNAQREPVSEIGSGTLKIEAQADGSNIQEGTSSGNLSAEPKKRLEQKPDYILAKRPTCLKKNGHSSFTIMRPIFAAIQR